jgi:hypothetical protein
MSRRAPSVLPVLHCGDLSAGRARPRASRSSSPLSLTRKESGILEMLDAAGATRKMRELG